MKNPIRAIYLYKNGAIRQDLTSPGAPIVREIFPEKTHIGYSELHTPECVKLDDKLRTIDFRGHRISSTLMIYEEI